MKRLRHPNILQFVSRGSMGGSRLGLPLQLDATLAASQLPALVCAQPCLPTCMHVSPLSASSGQGLHVHDLLPGARVRRVTCPQPP